MFKTESPRGIRVLLAVNHAILYKELCTLLGYYDDVVVVGQAHDGAEAVARVGELQPDIVLMDIAMPAMDDIEATRLIREQHPETRVLIVTQHEDRRYVLPLLQAGASGIVLKRALAADLITALRVVARGETFLCPSVATTVVEELHRQLETRETMKSLTSREREILKCIVLGQTNAEIAAALSLSAKMVEWHHTNLMSKLGVHSVADLVRYASQQGFVERNE